MNALKANSVPEGMKEIDEQMTLTEGNKRSRVENHSWICIGLD